MKKGKIGFDTTLVKQKQEIIAVTIAIIPLIRNIEIFLQLVREIGGDEAWVVRQEQYCGQIEAECNLYREKIGKQRLIEEFIGDENNVG